MSEFFLKIVNMSISASWLVLAVLLLRLVMKRAPKWISVVLWSFVAIRLMCPFTFESGLSLIPSAETIPPEIMTDPSPEVHTGISSLNNAINPIVSESFAPEEMTSMNPLQFWVPLAALVWGLGIAGMVIYTAVSYILLRRKVATAIPLRKGILQSENVDSPFVLGILRPKIYLPFQIDDQALEYVIAHEQSHIRRKDHWWKPFGFLLLAVHWFNPLMWLGYILLCRDIELACDEKVIKDMDREAKASYSEALVVCSVHRRKIAACPLAFGEVGVKERVKSVLHYKKPAFWIIATAVVICTLVAICFLTNPADSYGFGIQSIRGGTYTENNRTPCIELDYFLLRDGDDYLSGGRWISWLSEDDPEYTKTGTIPYDGSLGQYRLMLKFPKTGPSASFRKNHEEGKIYPLEGISGTFENQFHYKVIYPENGGMIIYFGSDIPFGYKEPGMYNTRYLSGPIQIRLYGFAEPDSPEPTYSNEAVTWFEYEPYMDWDSLWETTVASFPDVTFRATPEAMEAVTPQGTERLYAGMPIWNTFFYDLTGDGYPELCSTVSMGSGMVDTHIVVYDYVNKETYRLMDRGNFDYRLRLDKQYGGLLVDKYRYMESVILTTDKLVFTKGTLNLAQDETHTVEHSKDEIAQTITTDLKTYYRLKNGKWMSDTGVLYQYRLEITGRMPNAAVDTTFVYLSNLESIPFEQAWKAAGLSSNTDDYFEMGEAVLVELRTGDGGETGSTQPSGNATEDRNYISYEEILEDYRRLQDSADTMTEEAQYAAFADLFASIAHGHPDQTESIAQLTLEIMGYKVTFQDEEVFEIARDYAIYFSRYAAGDQDAGVQSLISKVLSDTEFQLEFDYWGEMWYSVKMVSPGENWVTGEFTQPYKSELGQYLMEVTFHDAEPSQKFLNKHPINTDLKFTANGPNTQYDMTMRVVYNADHGYHVYIGSDDPFQVANQDPVKLRDLAGIVAIGIQFIR